MLKELKFVQGAVAKKDLIPAMTHFRIEDGTVRSYNGAMALSSPIPFDLNCNPKAEPLVRAIDKCIEQITLSMTPAGKLRIQSGKFRAFIDCVDGEIPHLQPAGEEVFFDGEQLMKALKVLAPFIGNDASRPWTNGVLFRGQSAFATNNVLLVEYWLGFDVPFMINIPKAAITEMLRIDEPPTHAQIEKSSITFHFVDKRWIRTQLLNTEWPDLSKVLEKPFVPTPIDERVFEGLEVLKSFTDGTGRVYIKDGMLRTHLEEGVGATYEIPDVLFEGCYQMNMFGLLNGVATHADFSCYPEPCLFFGKRLRGAIVGMRM